MSTFDEAILGLVEAEKRRTSYNPKLMAAVEQLVEENTELRERVAKLEEVLRRLDEADLYQYIRGWQGEEHLQDMVDNALSSEVSAPTQEEKEK